MFAFYVQGLKFNPIFKKRSELSTEKKNVISQIHRQRRGNLMVRGGMAINGVESDVEWKGNKYTVN